MSQDSKANIVRTDSTDWVSERHRDLEYRYKDLSGVSIGARVEELPPGQSSSYHHYHTTEEEHIFILSGEAILIFGDEEICIRSGDHVRFHAGEEVAHHLENRSISPTTYLVYGERKNDDVVVYPEAQVMLVKSLGRKQFTYRPVSDGESN